MQPLKETIELNIDESNELLFKVQVEGNDVAPARVRLVCEGEDISYHFNGEGTDEPGIVQFVIPNMTGRIKEGVYSSSVEVLIDNRYFAPVQFDLQFKQPVKVTAESVSVPKKRASRKRDVTVSASPVLVEKSDRRPKVEPTPTPKPLQIAEGRRARKVKIEETLAKLPRDKPGKKDEGPISDGELRDLIESMTRNVLKEK